MAEVLGINVKWIGYTILAAIAVWIIYDFVQPVFQEYSCKCTKLTQQKISSTNKAEDELGDLKKQNAFLKKENLKLEDKNYNANIIADQNIRTMHAQSVLIVTLRDTVATLKSDTDKRVVKLVKCVCKKTKYWNGRHPYYAPPVSPHYLYDRNGEHIVRPLY